MDAPPGLPVSERRIVDAFVELADTLVEGFDLIDFVTSLTERVVGLGFADECGVLLVDRDGDLQYVAASHERTHLLELFRIQNEEGPCLDCFTTGGPVRAVDLEAEHDRWPQFTPRALSTGFRSAQAVPLRLRGNVLGAMNLFLTEPGGITRIEQEVVQAMADIATIGLFHQRDQLGTNLVAEQLQDAMLSRVGIEQAKGILAEQGHVTVDEAFELLRAHARRHHLTLSLLAATVVGGSTDFSVIAGARH